MIAIQNIQSYYYSKNQDLYVNSFLTSSIFVMIKLIYINKEFVFCVYNDTTLIQLYHSKFSSFSKLHCVSKFKAIIVKALKIFGLTVCVCYLHKSIKVI